MKKEESLQLIACIEKRFFSSFVLIMLVAPIICMSIDLLYVRASTMLGIWFVLPTDICTNVHCTHIDFWRGTPCSRAWLIADGNLSERTAHMKRVQERWCYCATLLLNSGVLSIAPPPPNHMFVIYRYPLNGAHLIFNHLAALSI